MAQLRALENGRYVIRATSNGVTAIIDDRGQLREQAPQFGLLDYPPGTVPGVDEPNPAWVFTRYDDVVGVLKDFETFSSR